MALLLAAILQIYLGALVAGLDAGLSFNTWPLIDGAFVPSAERLWFETPAWRNLFENALTVQFNHRMFAYALWLAAVLHAIDAHERARRGPARWRSPCIMTIQAAIGIATLLYQAPISLALAASGHGHRRADHRRRSRGADHAAALGSQRFHAAAVAPRGSP